MTSTSTENVKKPERAGNSRRWRRLRQAVQVLALLLFLYLLLGTRQGNTTFLPGDLFFRIDPLAGISAMLASRSWIAPMALGAVILLLALAAGRAWCSWLCPLGTLLDWTPARRPRRENLDIPPAWRQVKFFILFTILLAAALGSLTLHVLDPITLLFRTVSSVILPVFEVVVSGLEALLYRVGAFQPAVEWLDGRLHGWLLTGQPFYLSNLVLAAVFAAVLALNAVRPRFWCRYLCPLGGLLGLVSKATWLRHKVDIDRCVSCHRCSVICPTGTIDPERNFAASPVECTTCLDCVEKCPVKAIAFRGSWGFNAYQQYDPSRRQLLASLGAAVAGAALLRAVPLFHRPGPQPVRPPGTSENRLLSRCIRCGECVKVCPTGVIQPGSSVAQWEGLWTPVLATRLGYCDYSCNSCGQVCPTAAIVNLPLSEKQRTVIGIARIDQERCIPWAEGRECIVCEEMCPVPQKAIRLDGQGGGRHRSDTTAVRLPRVVDHLCIGCGICEHKCPVNGEAAIRMFAPTL